MADQRLNRQQVLKGAGALGALGAAAAPSHVDLSESFDYFPDDVIAASFGLNPQAFARLPKRGDVFIAAKK